MNGFTAWLRHTGENIRSSLRSFMQGRYGTDKLNTTLLGIGCAIVLLSMFFGNTILKLVLTLLAYALMILSIFRSFSRNTYQRYQENRWYLMLLNRFKDRTHRYYRCPKCRQPVRVPKGKGKIAITCPKCQEKFIKKT